ncbi:carbohydrate-binding protein [Dactylosporangium sp. CA-139066]|uniref:carbohydrate-binding protein n=1 Tax=Dactylosporangium sp. CA-139066 TaxID=3239930 RepID=UPI003D8C3396
MPTDASYVNDAKGLDLPVVGHTYSDFGAFKAHYVFAYNQNGTNVTTSFTPARLGLSGRVYVYNTGTGAGTLMDAGAAFTENIGAAGRGSYIAVPVGGSNIGFLGDAGKIASLGKKRIGAVTDDGTLHATVNFASGEGGVTLHGYAPSAPRLTMSRGTAGAVFYDAATRQFSVVVNASADGTAVVNLSAAASPATWYEAERATLSGPVASQEWPGFTGTGYADYQHASADYTEWTVTVGASGSHTLAFRYANGGGADRPLSITINGGSAANLSFPATADWSTWSTVTRTVTLNAGTYTIRATATGSSGANIDRLEVT